MAKTNPYYSGPVRYNYDGLRFQLPGHVKDKTQRDLLRWTLGGGKQKWPKHAPGPDRDRPPDRVTGNNLRVSYVGHASLLIQTCGLNILVDPVWSKRASPVQWAGPKRVNAPGIALDDLPPIDIILVSHNHYDHLDLATLSAIARKHRAHILTPLGNDTIMLRHDSSLRVTAHDWGARERISDSVAVHFEPAYHWSARGIADRRMALWCAFVIETPAGNIYHIADTGFSDGALFRDMGKKHGGFRLAILPIGAYEPRWFMRDQHIDPEEAVKIFQLCGAERALAHHWGTFQLTNEAMDAPPAALAEALQGAGISAELFVTRRPGEILFLGDPGQAA